MRYKIPRWVGLATLLITATKLGIPAFAQEFEPEVQSIDPSVEVIETIDPSVVEGGEFVDPSIEVVDPSIEVVDPSIEVVDPSIEVVDPSIEVVDPSIEVVDQFGEGSGAGDECVGGPPGLYATGCKTLARGVVRYEPAYKLWSDGADKERFIYLPPIDDANPDGPKKPIDATDPDRWIFPPNTRLYKTFLRKGTTTKYETRIIKKDEAGKWTMTTYAWDSEQKAASLLTTGQENVFGDSHDIPTQAQCNRCHTSPERVLGFSAIQLSPNGILNELIDRGELINWANADEKNLIAAAEENGPEAVELAEKQALASYVARATIPGDDTQKEAVGYLHANCGHCHGGPFPAAQMSLFSQVLTALPTDANAQPAPNGVTAICDPSGWTVQPTTSALPAGVKLTEYGYRINPGKPEDSAVLARMMIRDPGKPTAFKPNQMPPLATEQPDSSDGIVKVTNWIKSMTTTCKPVQPEVEAPEAVF